MKDIKCKFCKTMTELETDNKKLKIYLCPECFARFRYEYDCFGIWILMDIQKGFKV